jgi:hypothetical protein
MTSHVKSAPPCMRSQRGWTALVLLGALLVPASLRAHDDAETRSLRLLFAQGLALEGAGRWADALDRFKDVARVRPTANVKFHIALCLDRLGRLLQAEQAYHDASNAARGTTPEVIAEIEAHLLDLDARMPRLMIGVVGATESIAVRLDGAPVQPSKMLRADPGPHVAVVLHYGIPVAACAFSILERRTKFVGLTVYAPVVSVLARRARPQATGSTNRAPSRPSRAPRARTTPPSRAWSFHAARSKSP